MEDKSTTRIYIDKQKLGNRNYDSLIEVPGQRTGHTIPRTLRALVTEIMKYQGEGRMKVYIRGEGIGFVDTTEEVKEIIEDEGNITARDIEGLIEKCLCKEVIGA